MVNPRKIEREKKEKEKSPKRERGGNDVTK
jgi:hypothetical protein